LICVLARRKSGATGSCQSWANLPIQDTLVHAIGINVVEVALETSR